MSQIMTPDEIQNAAENLKAAFASGAISAREFDEGMTDVTKGVRGYTAELNASLNQLGTATKKLGEGLLQGQQGMTQYNDLTASAGDAAAKAAAQFGPLGIAIGAIIKVITFGISEVNKMSDGLYKANQDLAKSGAAGAEGMTGVFDNMQKFGYGISQLGEMSALIASNSNSLALLGGTVEQGTKQFANVASGIKNSDLQRQFMNMGMSVNDINTGIAGYISMQAQLGIESNQTTEQMTAGAAAYLEQQDKLTRITGQNADQLKSNQDKAQQVESFNALLSTMAPEEARKMQAGFDMLMKTSESAALGFAASVTGMTGISKDASEQFQATGGMSSTLSMQYRKNIQSGMDENKAAAIMVQGFADATAKNKGLINALAMSGGSAGAGPVLQANRMAALAGGKALEAAEAAEAAQDKTKEGFDKTTNEHTKMLQEQMTTRDSFQTLISKGIGPVTEGFSALSKTINNILRFIPGSGVPLGSGRSSYIDNIDAKVAAGGGTMAAPSTGTATGDKSALLNLIGKGETTTGDYNRLVDGEKGIPKNADLTNMTISQVMEYQSGMLKAGHASTAVGKYQMIAATLREQAKIAGLDITKVKFDASTQDLLASQLIDRAGYGKVDNATLMTNLSKTWASLPKDQTGAGYYDGKNGNKAHITPDEIMAVLNKNPTAARNAGLDKKTTDPAAVSPSMGSAAEVQRVAAAAARDTVAKQAQPTTGAPAFESKPITTAHTNMPTAQPKPQPTSQANKGQESLTPYQEQMLAEKRKLTAAAEHDLRSQQVVAA